MKVTNLTAREIKDSRGKPTIEVVLGVGDISVTASVPSGESAGSHEAFVKPVSEALVALRSDIAQALVGKNIASADAVDDLLLELDGTKRKTNLGGNTMLAVSIAATRAFAKEAGVPLWKYIAEKNGFTPRFPRLYMNTFEGGVHANWALPLQEYLLVPKEELPSAAYAKAQQYFKAVGKVVESKEYGYEGGYTPRYKTLHEPLAVLESVVGDDADLALDAAATEFNRGNMYMIFGESYSEAQLLKQYVELIDAFNILSIEDPFAEDAVEAFVTMTQEVGDKTLIVGDDLTATNPRVLEKMVAVGAGNALIIKPNQIGTLKEVYETVKIAHEAGWKHIVSHRGRETMDSFIADLAVGVGAYGIKAGAPSQHERVVKYERLMEIEKEIK